MNVLILGAGLMQKPAILSAKELGYKYGLAMDGGIYYTLSHKDLYSIPRIYANRSMTLSSFSNFCSKSNVKVTWE